MDKLQYKPVPHNHKAFLEKAKRRKGFKEAYENQEEVYAIIREMLNARWEASLTQEKVAKLMGTTKSAISRLESAGKHAPSIETLKKYAKAVGCKLEIKLLPKKKKRVA